MVTVDTLADISGGSTPTSVDPRSTVNRLVGRMSVVHRSSIDRYNDRCIGRCTDRGTLKDTRSHSCMPVGQLLLSAHSFCSKLSTLPSQRPQNFTLRKLVVLPTSQFAWLAHTPQFDYVSSSCSLIDLALICCRSSNTSFIVWLQLNLLLVLLESDILQESPKLVAFSDVQHSVNFQGLSDAFEPCLCWWFPISSHSFPNCFRVLEIISKLLMFKQFWGREVRNY